MRRKENEEVGKEEQQGGIGEEELKKCMRDKTERSRVEGGVVKDISTENS